MRLLVRPHGRRGDAGGVGLERELAFVRVQAVARR